VTQPTADVATPGAHRYRHGRDSAAGGSGAGIVIENDDLERTHLRRLGHSRRLSVLSIAEFALTAWVVFATRT
jgi:hypothetical protein